MDVSLILVCLSGELSQRDSKHKEEVAVLRKSISALDREKDALLDDVDQKTEKLVVLQAELSNKVLSSRFQAFIKQPPNYSYCSNWLLILCKSLNHN